MYNRYIPQTTGYTRIPEADDSSLPPSPPPTPETEETPAPKKSGGLAALLKHLKLEELDTGDVLLLLIILFLFLEGDDMELIITLALLLLLGLD